jgi:hypothetical protein
MRGVSQEPLDETTIYLSHSLRLGADARLGEVFVAAHKRALCDAPVGRLVPAASAACSAFSIAAASSLVVIRSIFLSDWRCRPER